MIHVFEQEGLEGQEALGFLSGSTYAVKACMLPRIYWHGMLRGRL